MKILMVSDFYPPFLGGSYRHVQSLSRHLVKRGHEVVVCTIGNKFLNVFDKDCGVKVIRLEGFFQKIPFLFEDTRIRHPPPILDCLIYRNLKKIVREEKPDIIHCHGWILYSVLQVRKKTRIPLVATLHDYGLVCPRILFLKEGVVCNEPMTIKCIGCAKSTFGFAKSLFLYYCLKLGRNELRFVDKFLAVSSFVKKVYSKHLNLNEKVITVVPNFCEAQDLKSARSTTFPEYFILFVGDLAPHKGVDTLIEAYSKLDTNAKLVLIGKRYPRHFYASTEKVIVIENAPHELVMNAYINSKFAVIPSRCPDACPTVALEAMSCKKAIIASNIGGLHDVVVNGKTGILVPSSDSRKLTEAMRYLLENPSKANEMGANGFKRFITNYTPEVTVRKIEKTYASLCNKRLVPSRSEKRK